MTYTLDGGADIGEMRLEVLDQVHRRQRLAREVRGAHRGAAAATDACVELEQLLPVEVLDLPNAEDFLLLDVLDLRQAARRVGPLNPPQGGRPVPDAVRPVNCLVLCCGPGGK